MKYYRITFSSKIDTVLADLVYEQPAYYVSGVTFPGDINKIDHYALYDCINITGATIGHAEYMRKDDASYVTVQLHKKPWKLYIKEFMCTKLSFLLHKPLCPDDENENIEEDSE